MLEAEASLGRREAKLRAAALTCVTGVALVQAIGLAPLFARSRPLGVLSLTAMTLLIALGWTLAAAPERASRPLWRVLAATAVLVLAGWAASRVLWIPGLPGSQGAWTAMPGAASAALAAVALALALVAARPTRASARGLLTAAALLAAMAPGTAALVVATAPGPAGGENALAASVHVHAHGSLAPELRFRAGSGRQGGHYVVAAPPQRSPTALDVVTVAVAALLFASGALGCLRRRSAPGSSATLPRLL
jgi:hypothetical protein